MGNKIPKTTGIFDDVDHPKSRWVTYWAERIGPLVDHIKQFSRCMAFGAIQKNHMLFFEYFKIGCMYLDNFFFIWKVWSGAMLVTISRTVTSITAFSVTKKPQKSRKKAKLSWGNTSLITLLINKDTGGLSAASCTILMFKREASEVLLVTVFFVLGFAILINWYGRAGAFESSKKCKVE